MSLPDWTASHVRMFAFFGGVSEFLVPDNLASGVSKAYRYDPEVNPTYQGLANHYGTAVLPTRPAVVGGEKLIRREVTGLSRFRESRRRWGIGYVS